MLHISLLLDLIRNMHLQFGTLINIIRWTKLKLCKNDRAAGYIKNNYEFTSGVSQMKHDLSLEPLCERRKQHRLHIFHKAVNTNIALPVPSYYLHRTPPTRNSTSSSYIQLMAHRDYYAQSFFPKTIKQWNSISPQIRDLDFLSFFSELH